jgi:hypothetical protein
MFVSVFASAYNRLILSKKWLISNKQNVNTTSLETAPVTLFLPATISIKMAALPTSKMRIKVVSLGVES